MTTINIDDKLWKLCRQGVTTSKALFRYGEAYQPGIEARTASDAEITPMLCKKAGTRVLAFARACDAMRRCLQSSHVKRILAFEKALSHVLQVSSTFLRRLLSPDIKNALLLTLMRAILSCTRSMRMVISAVGVLTSEHTCSQAWCPSRIFDCMCPSWIYLDADDSLYDFEGDLLMIHPSRSVLIDAVVLRGCQDAYVVLKPAAQQTLFRSDIYNFNHVPNITLIRVHSILTAWASTGYLCRFGDMRISRLIGPATPESDDIFSPLTRSGSTTPQEESSEPVQHIAELEHSIRDLGKENGYLYGHIAKLERKSVVSTQQRDRLNRKAVFVAQHLDRYYNGLRIRSEQQQTEQGPSLMDELKMLRAQNDELKHRLYSELEGVQQRIDALDEVEIEASSTREELKTVETQLVESHYARLETKFDRLRAEIELERKEHLDRNAALANQNLDTTHRLRDRQSEHKKLQAERDQLQAGLLRLQQEKHDERERLTSEIDSLRLYIESSAVTPESSRRRRRGQNGNVGAHHPGSQTVLHQEERYMSVLSLASDRVTHGGGANPSYERLPR